LPAGHFPMALQPHEVDRPEVRHHLGELDPHVIEITRTFLWRRTWVSLVQVRLGALLERRVVWVVTVRKRVIETHPKAVDSNSFDDLAGDVRAVWRVLNGEVR